MEGLWVGGGGAWSCHGLRRSLLEGRENWWSRQGGGGGRSEDVSKLWGRMHLEGKLAISAKIVLRVEKGRP